MKLARNHPGPPHHNQGPLGVTRTTFNKTRPPTGDGVSAYLCNFLDNHGVTSVKVLKKASLHTETQADWSSGDAVHALYMDSHQFMSHTLHTDSEAASVADASDEQSTLVDSDSVAS